MVLNVSSLLKTVKAVEDEHTRGTRAMEATVEAISQEIRAMNSPPPHGLTQSSPEDLIRVTKSVTTATAKAVAAGASNLQTDIVAAANIGRRAISEMLFVCRSVAWTRAETEELRYRTLEAGAAVGEAYRDLLDGILKNCSADERMHLSRRVAKCVTDLCAMARLLKGSDWIDPEDPTVIAENELLGAAASIDAAAKKLASLRPRRQPDIKMADENMKFDEMILEAAKSIMAASSALVRAANAAQRELIDQGKVSRRPLFSSEDGQWSEGLVSAARLVAAATHSLVESAQNLVRGNGTEEMLISSAKQVAASTAQLLIACKVKLNPNSESSRRLQSAGNAVIKSTDNLVRAAQQALDAEEEHILKINTSMVDGMAQEINARSDVLKMEKKLEEARKKLTCIRQARARQRNVQGFATDESGDEYQHGYSSPTSHQYQTNSLSRDGHNTRVSPNYQQQQYHQQQQQYNYQTLPSNYQQQKHQQSTQYLQNQPPPVPPLPQHFHHPDVLTSTVNFPPPPPPSPLISTSPSSPMTSTFRPNPTLTATAIPRPYPSGNNTNISGGGLSPISPLSTIKNNDKNNIDNTSLIKTSLTQKTSIQNNLNTNLNNNGPTVATTGTTTKMSKNLEACVQDLHDKTFGQGGIVQLTSTSKTPLSPRQNYEGFTSRYETRSYDTSNDLKPIEANFSQLKLHTNDDSSGRSIDLIKDGSERLSSIQQRVLERKIITRTTESRMEKKSEQHSFRLE